MPPAGRSGGQSPPARGDGAGARERWNRRYAERGVLPFASAPAPWLVENRGLLSSVRGRRALDVGCGDGRNAVYLARRGFTVDALDISDVAIDALAAAATERQLPVRALRLNLETDPLPDGTYDVIVQLNYVQRSLFARLAAALAPGGLVLAETVTTAHVDQLGKNFDKRFLLEPGELRDAFAELDLLRYQEGVHARSGGARAIASLVARRP